MPDVASPNVVLVHCHDLGRRLGCDGADLETPNVDRLAADGTRFTSYFAAAPQCSPSRGSISTGKHPQRHGLLGLTNVGGWELDRGEVTVGHRLQDAGYRTHLFGVQHQVRSAAGDRLGFDAVHDGPVRATRVAAAFADAADDLAAGDAPFFASLGFFEPHRPFRVDHVDDGAYHRRDPDDIDLPSWLPDRPGVRADLADLHALIEETVDPAVGRVRAALAAAGVADETLVVLTTDHGVAMPRAKGTCYDAGLGTALIASHPDLTGDGAVDDHLLSNVDLAPTLLDLAGAPSLPDPDGRSFAPLFDGHDADAYEPRDAVYAGLTWHDTYVPTRAVRTSRYKYVRNETAFPRVYMPADVFGGQAGRAMAWAYYTTNRPREELYDLERDPDETTNLVEGGRYERGADPRAPAAEAGVLDAMRARLDRWQAETGDPLLDGDVPAPERPDEALDVFRR